MNTPIMPNNVKKKLMKLSYPHKSFLVCFFVVQMILIFCFPLAVIANQDDILTPEERTWLTQHDGKIVLGHDPSARPIDFYDKHNVFRGLAADYVDLLQKKLNFKFKLSKNKTWAEVIEKAKKREIDVLCAFSKSPARTEWMNFTPPYIKIPAVILVRNEIEGSLTLDQMKDMRITFTKGWVVEDYLRKNYGHLNLVPVVDEVTAIKNVSLGQADAAVTALTSAIVHIEKYQITNLRVAGDTGFFFDLSIASRRDWPILNRILIKGLSKISQKERDAMYNKWIRFEKRPFYYSKYVLYSVLVVIVVIILIFTVIFVWNRTLKRQVAQKTKELKNEITERKRAEEQIKKSQILLKSSIESPNMIILSIDAQYRYLYFNKAHKESMISAYNKHVEIGMNILDCITDESDRNKSQINYDRALAGEKHVTVEEFGDLERLYYESRYNPILNDDNEIIGATAFAENITKRKQTEEQITASLKEKETLLHEIHHRVKNNMQVINSLLKLQSNSIEDQQVKNILKDSQSRVYAMSAVHEALHGSEKLSEIDLKSYLSKIATSIFQTYSVTPDKVKLNTDIEEIPISIDQASPLGLIINELISNSLKYAFPAGRKGEITVSLKKQDDELELIVQDDGVGIPDKLDWKNSNTLGLKLVKTLAENQLDGSINMENKDGTKFIIKFNIET
jgi:PAS domain S-box-containing protein